MKAEEFKSILSNHNLFTEFVVDGIIIEDDLMLSDVKIEGDIFYRFLNVIFLGDVTFSNVELNARLSFFNCQFKKEFILWRLHSKQVDNTYYLEIIGCELGNLKISNLHNIFGLSISNCKKVSYLDINSCKNIGHIYIFDNDEIENIHISSLLDVDILYLNGNKRIEKCLSLNNSSIKEVKFRFNFFIDFVDVKSIISNFFLLQNNQCSNRIKFSESNSIKKLQIEDNSTTNELIFNCDSTTKIENILISGGDYGHGFVINGSTDFKSIERINYTSSQKNIGPFYFNNLKLDWFILEGTVSNSSIVLNNIVLSDLTIRNLFNYGVISTSGLTVIPNGSNKLEIQNSSLGNFEIRSCDISLFSQIEITKSSLISIKTIQITWFDSKNLNKSYPISIDSLRTKREVYRQLKQAMSGQGDTIQSLEFKSLEMHEYKNELNLLPVTNWSWKHISDRLIMFMNQSNNFGLNWVKPVILAILFTLFTYFILSSIVFFKNPILFDNQCGLFYNFGVYLFHYKHRFFLLLDPIFKLKDVFECDKNCYFTSIEYFFAFIQRIGIAYFIFQTVAAFRKYLK